MSDDRNNDFDDFQGFDGSNDFDDLNADGMHFSEEELEGGHGRLRAGIQGCRSIQA